MISPAGSVRCRSCPCGIRKSMPCAAPIVRDEGNVAKDLNRGFQGEAKKIDEPLLRIVERLRPDFELIRAAAGACVALTALRLRRGTGHMASPGVVPGLFSFLVVWIRLRSGEAMTNDHRSRVYAFQLIPREMKFFDMFDEAAAILIRALPTSSLDMVTQFDRLAERSYELRQEEHACDDVVGRIIKALDRSFITPFDREDIHTLADLARRRAGQHGGDGPPLRGLPHRAADAGGGGAGPDHPGLLQPPGQARSACAAP